MCQVSRGPVQGPETVCPFHTVPQPVSEASVVSTTLVLAPSKLDLQRRAVEILLGADRLLAVHASVAGLSLPGDPRGNTVFP